MVTPDGSERQSLVWRTRPPVHQAGRTRPERTLLRIAALRRQVGRRGRHTIRAREFPVDACAAPPRGLPVLHPLHPLPCAYMPLPVSRQRRPASFVRAPCVGTGRCLPSPQPRRGGLRIGGFEACSAFSRATLCTLANPPDSDPIPPKSRRRASADYSSRKQAA